MGAIRTTLLCLLLLPLFALGQVGIAGEQADVSADKALTIVENMPLFPGGTDSMTHYIQSHLNYPSACKDSNITGTVYVQFIINAQGHVTKPEILHSVHPLLDAEAINVVSNMPDWEPGQQNGQKVDVFYSASVTFAPPKPVFHRAPEPVKFESFADNPNYQKILELLDHHNSKGALKEVNGQLRKNPKSGDLLLLRGIVHCYRKEQKDSIKDMQQAGLLGSHMNGAGALVDQYCR